MLASRLFGSHQILGRDLCVRSQGDEDRPSLLEFHSNYIDGSLGAVQSANDSCTAGHFLIRIISSCGIQRIGGVVRDGYPAPSVRFLI